MWRRPAWFSLKGKVGVRCRKKTLSYATQPLSTNHPADPCNICGRPLPGKGKLQDCRGAWSDAAICPASGAAANRRGPVWERLWGGRRDGAPSSPGTTDGAPHAERPMRSAPCGAPHAERPMRSAPCGAPHAERPMRSAPCGAPHAERPMPQRNDLSRSLLALDQNSTIIAVIEMSQSNWLVAGIIPGVDRQPLKKLEPDEKGLLRLLRRWQDEAARAGRTISRIAVAFEAGRDGFWLARWLRARGIEAYVIHPASIPVSREHRRAKTDRLDTELLKRAFLGWLRGEPNHCSMAAVPTLEQEDAKRPNRERETLVSERTRLAHRGQ